MGENVLGAWTNNDWPKKGSGRADGIGHHLLEFSFRTYRRLRAGDLGRDSSGARSACTGLG